MDFLSPFFWLGAAAVAAPILLHLVQKEKQRRIPFPSLMLMPVVRIKQMRRRKLTHLFLLLLRCLGILLLVTAFARPVVSGAWFGSFRTSAARSVIVLLDNSMSMARSGVWERALAAAETRLRNLGELDQGLIMTFAEGGHLVSSWQSGRQALVEILRNRVEPSFQSTSYAQALQLAVDQFGEENRSRKEIYLITDLQRSGLSSSRGWKVPEDILVELKDVGEAADNIYVDEIRLSRNVFGKKYPGPLLIRLAGSPPRSAGGTAQLFLKGLLIDQIPFEIGEEGVGQITFSPFPLDEGISRGRIVLQAEDHLQQDNNHYFVLERQVPRRVLVISPPGHRSGLYLQTALSSGDNLAFQVELAGQLPLQLDPDRTPLVILDDLRRLPPVDRLRDFVQAGGGLIVAPGDYSRATTYSKEWEAFLPAVPRERKFVRSRKRSFTSLTDISWEHPIFSVFQEGHKASIATTPFYGYWLLQLAPDAKSVARFEGGDHALVEKKTGEGRVLVFASTLDTVWNDFPVRAAFVPFWSRTIRHTSGWQEAPAALTVSQTLPPRPKEQGDKTNWSVIDPTGTRLGSLEGDVLPAVQLQLPGHYEIRDNKNTEWVAVNVLPLESDLSRVAAEDLLAVFVPGNSQLQNTVTTGGKVDDPGLQSIWWLFLLCAALVFATESIVANRSSAPPGAV